MTIFFCLPFFLFSIYLHSVSVFMQMHCFSIHAKNFGFRLIRLVIGIRNRMSSLDALASLFKLLSTRVYLSPLVLVDLVPSIPFFYSILCG
jgi:hypothetical protein